MKTLGKLNANHTMKLKPYTQAIDQRQLTLDFSGTPHKPADPNGQPDLEPRKVGRDW